MTTNDYLTEIFNELKNVMQWNVIGISSGQLSTLKTNRDDYCLEFLLLVNHTQWIANTAFDHN